MINVGVIGYGYWGPHVVRSLLDVADVKLSIVSTMDADRRELVERRHPGVSTTENYRDILSNPSIDAVAVITEPVAHYELALAALRAGKHVWIEKPMTLSSDTASRLVDEASKRNLTLFVDYTFIYTGAVRKMRDIVASGRIGNPQYYDSMRTNLGLHRPDVNVLWDLAVHDLSITDFVLRQYPIAVSATAIAHVKGMPENVGFMTCFYASGLIAHINVSWITPIKVRRTLIGGDKQMILYDDNEPVEKVKVYDRGVKLTAGNGQANRLVGYRNADTWTPALDGEEALRAAVTEFAKSIRTECRPITDGEFGIRVSRVIEAAISSTKNRGACVEISSK
jgi:predicted dehydrogenase